MIRRAQAATLFAVVATIPVGSRAQDADGALEAAEAEAETTSTAETEAETTSTAAADETPEELEARIRFRSAQELYEAGRFEAAAELFEEAYALVPHPELAYNLYLAHRDAGALELAAEWLGRYLREETELDGGRRMQLEARLTSLERQLQERRRAASGPSPLPWIVMAVGGAALVGGGITGVLALGVESDLTDVCPNDACPPGYDLEGKRSDGDTLATLTNVLIVGGAVAAATGAALLFFLSDGDEEPPVRAALGCTGHACSGEVDVRF